jgi:hypothetical protein
MAACMERSRVRPASVAQAPRRAALYQDTRAHHAHTKRAHVWVRACVHAHARTNTLVYTRTHAHAHARTHAHRLAPGTKARWSALSATWCSPAPSPTRSKVSRQLPSGEHALIAPAARRALSLPRETATLSRGSVRPRRAAGAELRAPYRARGSRASHARRTLHAASCGGGWHRLQPDRGVRGDPQERVRCDGQLGAPRARRPRRLHPVRLASAEAAGACRTRFGPERSRCRRRCRFGYIPDDYCAKGCANVSESCSRTLNYYVSDAAIAKAALRRSYGSLWPLRCGFSHSRTCSRTKLLPRVPGRYTRTHSRVRQRAVFPRCSGCVAAGGRAARPCRRRGRAPAPVRPPAPPPPPPRSPMRPPALWSRRVSASEARGGCGWQRVRVAANVRQRDALLPAAPRQRLVGDAVRPVPVGRRVHRGGAVAVRSSLIPPPFLTTRPPARPLTLLSSARRCRV